MVMMRKATSLKTHSWTVSPERAVVGVGEHSHGPWPQCHRGWLGSCCQTSLATTKALMSLLNNHVYFQIWEFKRSNLFCNAYLHLTQFGPLYFWHKDTQEYYPCSQKTQNQTKQKLIMLLIMMAWWIRENSIYHKIPQSRWLNKLFPRLEILNRKTKWKHLKNSLDLFTNVVFCLAHLVLTIT